MPEPSRRRFLGAAAALAALPVSSESADSTPEQATSASEQIGDSIDPEEFGPRTAATASGGFNYLQSSNLQTEVIVSSHPEAVSLELRTGLGAIDAALYPEDVDALINELLQARARLVPEEVEYVRELDEKYPPEEIATHPSGEL